MITILKKQFDTKVKNAMSDIQTLSVNTNRTIRVVHIKPQEHLA